MNTIESEVLHKRKESFVEVKCFVFGVPQVSNMLEKFFQVFMRFSC
jgi:hypothetical protein